jgi:hypothetical protein
VIVCKFQGWNTMPRSPGVLAAAALLLASAIAVPVAGAIAAGPQEAQARPEDQKYTPEQRMARRYPQPVKVGALVGLPVLDGRDSTFGYVREVVRTADGTIVLVVPYRDWLGWAPTDWGRKTVAVPLEAVAILGRQVAALDFSRADFSAAPPYAPTGTTLSADETIRIAVYRR